MPPIDQSLLRAAKGAQLTSASTAQSSQDLNGPRPAGTLTDFRSQRSRCARGLYQLCEHSRSCTTAMHRQGTPVRADTAW
ncbi:hypothetical protein [Bradyrhizobium sp. AZCC 2230]|uniref:hypothetical protein n=1 Tax=Bradyrhizobium sp. AZCC 2230 TaxID=3117021 RepID=UPI002FF16459